MTARAVHSYLHVILLLSHVNPIVNALAARIFTEKMLLIGMAVSAAALVSILVLFLLHFIPSCSRSIPPIVSIVILVFVALFDGAQTYVFWSFEQPVKQCGGGATVGGATNGTAVHVPSEKVPVVEAASYYAVLACALDVLVILLTIFCPPRSAMVTEHSTKAVPAKPDGVEAAAAASAEKGEKPAEKEKTPARSQEPEKGTSKDKSAKGGSQKSKSQGKSQGKSQKKTDKTGDGEKKGDQSGKSKSKSKKKSSGSKTNADPQP